MSGSDYHLHARGETRYVDDLPEPQGTLHGAVFGSPAAHGKVRRLEVEAARSMPGVVAVLTGAEVPGQNQIGTVVADEPLFAEGEVHCVGQPMALVVAETAAQARAARDRVRAEVDPLPAVFDPRQAFAMGMLLAPPRTFAIGETEAAWSRCAVVVEGRADSGSQEHLYLETQAALAVPVERGGLLVHSATQAPTVVQKAIARAVGCPMHAVEVNVPRLGGGFGGKEDQATAWAVMAAVAARRLGRPVKVVLRRGEDMRFTGKRHPYSSDFRLGLDAEGRFVAYEATYYQNAGCTTDLSLAILERTLFHATNAYRIPNVRATAASCRTNLPSNTAFRGFGGPQAMFVLECAIRAAADRMGLEPRVLQARNLVRDGDEFPYGMRAHDCAMTRCWAAAEQEHGFDAWFGRVRAFNEGSRRRKKGLALMPVCFGISFTTTHMNQASALVHVYTDGSVGVSTAAVEMGQGVTDKLRAVAARALGVAIERVRVESTNTTRVANTSPTAASTGADMNGNATRIACESIRDRLLAVAAERLGAGSPSGLRIEGERVWRGQETTDLAWGGLVADAFLRRVSLSAQAHYATPGLHFDKTRNKGVPFAYHVTGVAGVEVTLDALLGTYTIDAVRIVHDAGESLDRRVDLGQVEGGLVQGLGWMTVEEVRHAPDGRLLTDTLTTYKVPDLYFAPKVIETHFLEGAGNPLGPYHSKAIGEPPLMYGIGAFFALVEAMRAAKPGLRVEFVAPMTPERVLASLAQASAGRPGAPASGPGAGGGKAAAPRRP